MKKCLLLLAMSVLAFSCKKEAAEPESDKVGYINLEASYEGLNNASANGMVHILQDGDTLLSFDYGLMYMQKLRFPVGYYYEVCMENPVERWVVKTPRFRLESYKTSDIKLECPMRVAFAGVSYYTEKFSSKYPDYEIEFQNYLGDKFSLTKSEFDSAKQIQKGTFSRLAFMSEGAPCRFKVTLRATRLDGTVDVLNKEFPASVGIEYWFAIDLNDEGNLDVALSHERPYRGDAV